MHIEQIVCHVDGCYVRAKAHMTFDHVFGHLGLVCHVDGCYVMAKTHMTFDHVFWSSGTHF